MLQLHSQTTDEQAILSLSEVATAIATKPLNRFKQNFAHIRIYITIYILVKTIYAAKKLASI